MQVVAAIVQRKHAARVLGIANRSVEIDDTVEYAAGPNPSIEPLPDLLLRRCIVAVRRALKRQQGRAIDAERFPMSPVYQLLQARLQIGEGDFGFAQLSRHPDVVDAE